jgi:hypothetical protein
MLCIVELRMCPCSSAAVAIAHLINRYYGYYYHNHYNRSIMAGAQARLIVTT